MNNDCINYIGDMTVVTDYKYKTTLLVEEECKKIVDVFDLNYIYIYIYIHKK